MTTQDLMLERSLYVLNNRINDISYLLALWKLCGSIFEDDAPEPERITPWWKGLY